MIQHIPPRLTTSSLLVSLYRHTNPYTKILLTTLGYVDFGDQCRFVMICVCAYIYTVYIIINKWMPSEMIYTYMIIYVHIFCGFVLVSSTSQHSATCRQHLDQVPGNLTGAVGCHGSTGFRLCAAPGLAMTCYDFYSPHGWVCEKPKSKNTIWGS